MYAGRDDGCTITPIRLYNTCPNVTLAMQLFPNSPSFPNFHHLTAFRHPSHSTAEAETCIPRRVLWAQPCL